MPNKLHHNLTMRRSFNLVLEFASATLCLSLSKIKGEKRGIVWKPNGAVPETPSLDLKICVILSPNTQKNRLDCIFLWWSWETGDNS